MIKNRHISAERIASYFFYCLHFILQIHFIRLWNYHSLSRRHIRFNRQKTHLPSQAEWVSSHHTNKQPFRLSVQNLSLRSGQHCYYSPVFGDFLTVTVVVFAVFVSTFWTGVSVLSRTTTSPSDITLIKATGERLVRFTSTETLV